MKLETDRLTAEGTYSVAVIPGQRYIFSASGEFGGGTLYVDWIDDESNNTSFPRAPITAAASFDFIAPTKEVWLVLGGATDPNIVVGVTLVPMLGDPVNNANVVSAIEFDPAAVVTALSKITDTASTTINLVAADSGKILRCTSGSAVTINMPSTDPGGNFSVAVIRAGAGSVTFAANGKTLNSYNSLLAIAGQHAWASLIRVAANTYNLSGTLA